MPSNQSDHYCSSKGSEEGYLFEQLKIQDGCTGLWLADIFSTSSPELLHVKPADLTEMIHKRFSKRVIVFQSDLKSNMAVPGRDIFLLFPKLLHLKNSTCSMNKEK